MKINEIQPMEVVSTDICQGISYVIVDREFNCNEFNDLLMEEIIKKGRNKLLAIPNKENEQHNDYSYYVSKTLEELNIDYKKKVVLLIIGEKELKRVPH